PHDFDVAWRYATRNRLGHWNAVGHDIDGHDIDGESADWIVFSDSERLFIERSHAWSAESREAIAAVFRTRAELHRLRRIVEQEETAERPRLASNNGIIGESASLREVTSRIALVAKRDVAVCVLGESGTGKELVARAIHV